MQGRILFLDLTKCVAIWLVLWGHAITELMPQDLSVNKAYLGIYSFHMPLFMLVSGLFAKKSFGRSFVELAKSKFFQLLLPTFAFFGIAWWVISHFANNNDGVSINYAGLFNLFEFIKHELSCYWFLKSLFVCYIIGWCCWKCGKKRWYAVFVVLSAFLYLQHWNVTCYKTGFMFPFFMLGIYLGDKLDTIKNYSLILLPISIITFACLLPFYSLEYSFQAKMFNGEFGNAIVAYAFFLVMGMVGSTMVMSACVQFEKFFNDTVFCKILAFAGAQTLGIYLWQKLLLELLLPIFVQVQMNMDVYNYLFTPLLATIFLFVISFGLKQKKKVCSCR